ncbi:Aldehyde dehydrogenase family protein [compost metagenome]
MQISSGVKNATLVLGETDFKTLMPEILRPFLLGQGQMGWNISRVFILESVQKEFIEALTDYMNSLKRKF